MMERRVKERLIGATVLVVLTARHWRREAMLG